MNISLHSILCDCLIYILFDNLTLILPHPTHLFKFFYFILLIQEAKNLLSRLLIRDPKERLGSGERDAHEVKEHPFFNAMDWDGLANGRVSPPWSPAVASSMDTSQFDLEFTSMLPISKLKFKLKLGKGCKGMNGLCN